MHLEFALAFLELLGSAANAIVQFAEAFPTELIAIVQFLADGHHLGLNVGQLIPLQHQLLFPGAQVTRAFAVPCAVCLAFFASRNQRAC